MSLIIAVHVPEGIVMASDSRSSITKEGDDIFSSFVQSDSVYKTFLAPNDIGISACGNASINNVPISGYIDSFISECVNEYVEIDSVPKLLLDYFGKLNKSIVTNFFVAGYKNNNGEKEQHVWKVETKDNVIKRINQPGLFGSNWDGETEVVGRLTNNLYKKNSDGSYSLIKADDIDFNYFTLQDAIDYAVYCIRTTIDAVRFLSKPKTVGGPIDVLVIKPNKAFWLKRKELTTNC